MRMKKLTLDINERQEQEDYQGTALLTAALKGFSSRRVEIFLNNIPPRLKYSVGYRDDAVTRPAPGSR